MSYAPVASQPIKWGSRQAALFSSVTQTLQHRQTIDVNLAALNMSAHDHVMSFVPLHRVGIVYGQHLLVRVGNDDRARSAVDAFFRTRSRARIGALRAAVGIANPTVHGLSIARK